MTTFWSPRTARWSRGAAAALAALSLLASVLPGCGGGVGGEGTGGNVGGEGTGSTATLASGPISGFGSIVVNGVHYDVASASVDDLGGGGRTNTNLQLGMVVEVAAGAIDNSSGRPRAVAAQVRVAPELLGPVDSLSLVDNHSGTLQVMGFVVRVDAATNLDAYPGGLSTDLENKVVEVFGYYNVQNNEYVATRLQPRSGPVTRFLVRGPVSGFNPAGSFRINGQAFNFTPGAVPAGVADGSFARLELQAARDADGHWRVTSSASGAPSRSEAGEAELKGRVSDLSQAASGVVSVDGVKVDASVIGLPAGLALGVRVEVEGRLASGVLVARKLSLESDDDARGLEYEGTLTSLNTSDKTFRLQGERGLFSELFAYSDATVLLPSGSSVASLANRKVELKGRLSSDRSRVDVTLVQRED